MAILLSDLVRVSAAVGRTRRRSEKVEHLAELLRQADPAETRLTVLFLTGELRQGRIGVGPAQIRAALPGETAPSPSLSLTRVDGALERIAGISGPGSVAERGRCLRDLFLQATRDEQGFLVRLLHGELRQGALEGVMVEAVARAARVGGDAVRRALMLSGDLAAVAESARAGGSSALARYGLRVFQPVQPMLAQSADAPADALERLGTAVLEWKLDGARVQVHRVGGDVRVFSRQLNDVTGAVPEIVEAVLALPVREIVLDGETLALRDDGMPYPFQTTMRRFGRKLDVASMRRELSLSTFYFDLLHADGDTVLDRSLSDRLGVMDTLVPVHARIPRLVTAGRPEADAFLEGAREAGHEGIMAKAPEAPYEAGRRGAGWLKVKPANTLDLVVLAAEWGHGRRQGWLSNLHLGARDPASGGFVMLGKTFKGLTDRMLEWQTRVLQDLEVGRNRHTVFVEPRLVVEVAFNEVQASSRYAGGVALRFARVKAYRPDKDPHQADTLDAVRALYAAQTGVHGDDDG